MKRIAKLLLLAAFAALLAPTAQAAEYELAIAGLQVTDANKDDILGDGGSVRFSLTGTNGTLTLSNAAITNVLGDYRNPFGNFLSGIVAVDEFALTIVLEGSNVVKAVPNTGIYANELTITGGGSLSLVPDEGVGIYAEGDLTIDGVTISDIGSGGGGIECLGNLTITNADVTASNRDSRNGIVCKRLSIGGASRLEAITTGTASVEGKRSALWSKNGIEIGDGLVVLEPSPYWIADNTIHAEGDSGVDGALRVVIGPPVAYPLWVGSTQVTSANATNILGDGTASFVGSASGGTLYLSNARITEAVEHPGINTAVIWSGVGFDLTISLAGSNRVEAAESTSNDYCVFARSNLSITGEGTLVAERAGDYVCGIFAHDNLRIDGATVTVSAGGDVLVCGGHSLAISNATVTVTATGGYGVYISAWPGRIDIADSVVTATGCSGGLVAPAGTIAISGASVVTAVATNDNGSGIYTKTLVPSDGLAITEPAGGTFSGDPSSSWNGVIDPATGAEAKRVVIEPPRYAVTVEGGSTTNTTARAGETVTVVAGEPEPGKAFVQWAHCDGVDFGNASAAETSFTMPWNDVTVTAVFAEFQIDSIPDQEWTGSAVEPDVRAQLKDVDLALVPGETYTVSYTNNVDPGTVTATVTMAPPRTGHASVTFQILPPPEPPAVSNVVARQRWPWNGLVDVDYEVGGDTNLLAVLEARISFTASDGRSWAATNFLAGAEPSAMPGPHRATWDTAADGAANVVAGSVAAPVELVRASFRRLALDFGGFGVRTDAAAYRATLYDLAGNPTKDPLTVAIGDAPPPDALFEFVPFATRKAVVEFLDGDGNVLCETAVEGDAFPGPSLDPMVVVPVREGDPVTLRVVHAWPAETETADVRIVYDDGFEKRVFVEGAAFDAASGTCESVFRAAGGAASVKSVTLLRNGIAFEWLDYAAAPASADGALELDVDGNEFANGAYAAGTAMQVANPRHLDNVRNHPRGGSFVQVKDIDFAGSCGILNAVAIAKGETSIAMTSTRSVVDAKARFYGREVADYGWFYGWLPIGSEASPFVGTYDGGGFRIANAVGNAVDASSNHALSGLFGVVGDENAEGAETVVTNVVLAGSCSFHSNYLSALVCKNRGRLAIRDCDSAAEHFSAQYAAGMCGEQHEEDKRGWHVSIDGCRTGGRILGKWCGGMLSYVSYGFAALSGCVFDGTMVAWENLGGMVYYCGINTDARCTIGNCTVKGTLSIPNGATTPASGGLIGELKATLALTGNNLASCEMEYSGSKKIGGVIGRSDFSEANLRAVLSGHVTVATGVVHDVSQENKIGTYCGEPWIDSL